MQPSNNEDNDGDGDGEGDNMAGHVEGVGGVAGSPSPDGTTSKAAAALAAAAEAAKVCRMSDNHVKGASIFDVRTKGEKIPKFADKQYRFCGRRG